MRLGPVLWILAATLLCAPASRGQAIVLSGAHNLLKMSGYQPYLSFCTTETCAGTDYIGFLWGQTEGAKSHLALGTGTDNAEGSIRFYLHDNLQASISNAGLQINGVTTGYINAENVHAYSTNGNAALKAIAESSSFPGTGVRAEGTFGVYAIASGVFPGGTAVRAQGESPYTAGQFVGDVQVSGTLTKSSGAFRIDHPLAPETKFLYHSFVESPDMKNIYDGVVETDAAGEARVELPEWFEALNRDFRYQLTVIGRFAQAIVAEEIHDNRFLIQTDEPGVRVPWQVTGIRQDPYAEAHRIPVEQDKPPEQVGRYLHPELYDAPPEMSVDWRPELQ